MFDNLLPTSILVVTVQMQPNLLSRIGALLALRFFFLSVQVELKMAADLHQSDGTSSRSIKDMLLLVEPMDMW